MRTAMAPFDNNDVRTAVKYIVDAVVFARRERKPGHVGAGGKHGTALVGWSDTRPVVDRYVSAGTERAGLVLEAQYGKTNRLDGDHVACRQHLRGVGPDHAATP